MLRKPRGRAGRAARSAIERPHNASTSVIGEQARELGRQYARVADDAKSPSRVTLREISQPCIDSRSPYRVSHSRASSATCARLRPS